MKIDVFTVASIVMIMLGITILITSYNRLDFGLIYLILLFTIVPIAYIISLFRNKKKNRK